MPCIDPNAGWSSERGPGMPGTRHEPAVAAPARVATVRGWRDLRALEPALHTLHQAAGIPVTARLAWWRAALMADRDAIPLLLALPGPGGTLTAAALVALRDQDGEYRITSVRPHTDDVWDVAAVSSGARHTVLAGLIRYAARLSCPWRLTLTGLRDGDEAELARRAASRWPRGARAAGPRHRLRPRRGAARARGPQRPRPVRAPDPAARADRDDPVRARAGPAGRTCATRSRPCTWPATTTPDG